MPEPAFVISASKCNHDNSHPRDMIRHERRCTFQVAWTINAHMKIGAVNTSQATDEHEAFRQTLRTAGARLYQVPFVHAAYDSVFIKDNAVLGRAGSKLTAFLANPKCEQRKSEQEERRRSLENIGFEIAGTASHSFEGGDLVFSRSNEAFLGHGFRSSPLVASELSNFLRMSVTPFELQDPYFYHLDTALAILEDGTAFAYRGAFTPTAWRRLQTTASIKRLIPIPRDEALKFALNWVEIGDTVVIGSHVPKVVGLLESMGKKVQVTPLKQFQYAGGSAACLTARIHQLN
jgi:N-dimethylarginine dimethylaminohydrolase